MAAYIDLSEKHGHRSDHGFACGAEFNIKIRRRVNIPDFVREQLSQGAIDAIWWEEAEQARDSLKEALSRRYKWIGELSFVGRGPGWLAIEDTACGSRNWDTIGKVVDQYLKNFIKSMESPRFWREVKGIEKAAAKAVSHSTRRSGFVAPEVRYAGTSRAPVPRVQTAGDRRRIAAEVDSLIKTVEKEKKKRR